jgi:hypothetical protein
LSRCRSRRRTPTPHHESDGLAVKARTEDAKLKHSARKPCTARAPSRRRCSLLDARSASEERGGALLRGTLFAPALATAAHRDDHLERIDMAAASKGMIQVWGTTYRLVQRADVHEVVRVLDDSLVGAFRHHPTLRVVSSVIPPNMLLGIAAEALRSARLGRSPNDTRRPSWLAAWKQGIRARWAHFIAALDYLPFALSRLRPIEVSGHAPRPRAGDGAKRL